MNATNIADAFPNIWYHISEKEFLREKNMGIFDLGACQVARSLQARLASILEPGGTPSP